MSALSGQTVLVTGANGFIGTHLARRLRGEGAIVHGAARGDTPGGDACDAWWRVDIADMDEVRRVFEKVRPSHVFHLAGLVSGSRDLGAVLPTLRTNLVGAANVLVAAAERGGIRLLMSGSLEEPQPDGDWPVPASPYAAAKHASGAYARMFHALFGTAAVWLRLFMVYGPAQRDTRKLVPYVIGSLLRGESPELSAGAREVDWVYVDDVVDAFLAAAMAPGVQGQTLDIGSGTLVTVREVVEHLVRAIAPGVRPRYGAVPERPFEQVRVADVEATAARLGWRPRVSLADGLRKTIEWYRGRHALNGNPVSGGNQ